MTVECTDIALADGGEICHEIVRDRLDSLFEIASELPSNDVSAPSQLARYAVRNVHNAPVSSAEQVDASSRDRSYQSEERATTSTVPTKSSKPHTTHQAEKTKRPKDVAIHPSSEENGNKDKLSSSQSNSSLESNLDQGRRAGSLSPHSRYQVTKYIKRPRGQEEVRDKYGNRKKRDLRERELGETEDPKSLGREEREARKRVERLERLEQKDLQDSRESRQRERHESRRRARLAVEREQRYRERLRREQEREDLLGLQEEEEEEEEEEGEEENERLRAQRTWRDREEEDIERETLPIRHVTTKRPDEATRLTV